LVRSPRTGVSSLSISFSFSSQITYPQSSRPSNKQSRLAKAIDSSAALLPRSARKQHTTPPRARASSRGRAALDRLKTHASPSTSSHAAAAPCLRQKSRHRGRPPAAATRSRVLQCRATAPPRPEPGTEGTHSRRAPELPQRATAQYKAPRQAGSKTTSRSAHLHKQKEAAHLRKQVRRPPRLPLRSVRCSCASPFCRTTARRDNGPEERSCSRRTAQRSTSGESGTLERAPWKPGVSTRNNEGSCSARAQGRLSNHKGDRHLRVHGAALRSRLPRPVLSRAGSAAAQQLDYLGSIKGQ